MLNTNKVVVNPEDPKNDEVAPAVENFNDGDDTQVVNTADDAFDEAKPAADDKVAEKEALPPGSTGILNDGEKPVLNQDDKSL